MPTGDGPCAGTSGETQPMGARPETAYGITEADAIHAAHNAVD